MIDERELWACANLLMRQHGSEAWLAASQRADELLAAGDIQGSRVFGRILKRIEELEQLQPTGATH